MRKIIKKTLVILLIIIGMQIYKNVEATTFNFDINKGITLYSVPYYYKEYLSVPTTYPTTFQIQVNGNDSKITYKNESQDRAFAVNETGYITLIDSSSYFYEGDFKLSICVENDPYITIDDEKYNTTVKIVDYSQIYAHEVLDKYIEDNITSDMTQYQIAQKACEYVCQYPYGYGSGTSASLMLYGYGDCFASCDTIEYILNKFNITCAPRAAFLAGSTGSNHNNVAAILDGKLMQVEAGYNQKKTPRNYSIREIPNNGIEVSSGIAKLYSGFDSQVTVPSTYGTNGTVTEIGDKAFAYSQTDVTSITLPNTIVKIGKKAFEDLDKLTYLNIPASVTEIDATAFRGCISLKSIDIDANNPYFAYENGIIYNKDKTKIIASLPGVIKGNISFIPSVKEIGNNAFSYNTNITGVTFGPNIEKIDADAFVYTNMTGVTIPNTVSEIGNYAFSSAGLTNIVIEKGKDITIGNNAFTNNMSAYIYVPSTITNNLDNISSVAKTNYNTLMVENNSQMLQVAQNNSNKYEIVDLSSKIKLTDNMYIIPKESINKTYTYTGSPIEYDYYIQYGGTILEEGKDYTVSHKDNINAGKDTITITGQGNYTGTITKDYNISKADPEFSVDYKTKVKQGDAYDITINTNGKEKTKSITYYDSNNNKISKPTNIGTYYFSIYIQYASNYNNIYEKYKYEIVDKNAILKGDLDRNNVIDANDASMALEIYKAENATNEDIEIGDMDGNNLIDANDASLILELYKTNN